MSEVQKISVSVEVTKEGYELGQGIYGFIKAMKEALSNGWQTGEDLPVALTAAMTVLIPSLQGADKSAEEAKEELEAFVTGMMLSTKQIGFMFYKKEVPAVEQ